MIPTYYNYENASNIDDCVHNIPTPDDLIRLKGEETLNSWKRCKISVVLLLDEIQCLYDKTDEVSPEVLNRKREIVQRIAQIGKSDFNFGVVTGSSSCAKEWCLHPKEYGFGGYLTLNHSVYVPVTLQPIRNKTQFYDVVNMMFNRPTIDDNLLCKYYAYSGGIGRALSSMENKTAFDIIDVEIPSLYGEDKAVKQIIDEMCLNILDSLQKSQTSLNCFDFWENDHSISIQRVYMIIKTYHPNVDEINLLISYVDRGVFVILNFSVELVCPGSFAADIYITFGGFELFCKDGFTWGSNRIFPRSNHRLVI